MFFWILWANSAHLQAHSLTFWSSGLCFISFHAFREISGRRVTADTSGRNGVWKQEQPSSHRVFGLVRDTDSNKTKSISEWIVTNGDEEAKGNQLHSARAYEKETDLSERSADFPPDRGICLSSGPVTRLSKEQGKASVAGAERGRRIKCTKRLGSGGQAPDHGGPHVKIWTLF